jgi:hypothetical protein
MVLFNCEKGRNHGGAGSDAVVGDDDGTAGDGRRWPNLAE